MRNERPLVIILIGLVGCLLTSSAGITGYIEVAPVKHTS